MANTQLTQQQQATLSRIMATPTAPLPTYNNVVKPAPIAPAPPVTAPIPPVASIVKPPMPTAPILPSPAAPIAQAPLPVQPLRPQSYQVPVMGAAAQNAHPIAAPVTQSAVGVVPAIHPVATQPPTGTTIVGSSPSVAAPKKNSLLPMVFAVVGILVLIGYALFWLVFFKIIQI